MKNISLEKSLRRLAAFSIAITVILAVMAYAVSGVYMDTLSQATEKRMHEETASYKDKIETQIDHNFELLNTLAGVIGVACLEGNSSLDDALQVADTKNDFLLFGYYDKNGKGRVSVSQNSTTYNVDLSEMQEEVQEIVSKTMSGEECVSEAFMGDLSAENVFVFSVPVYHDHEVAGALVASAGVYAFSQNLGEQELFYGSGYVHLLNNDGDFIVRGEDVLVDDDAESILKSPYISKDEMKSVQQDMKELKTTEFTISFDGVKYNAILEPIDVNGWYLLCLNSLKNVNQNIYILVYVAAAFFIAMVALFFFTLRFGYQTMKKINIELREAAYYDDLTGILNMRRFQELASESIVQGKDYAIAVLNVRQFKFINEFFRREEADRLLQYIGRVLSGGIDEEEFVCRESADFFYLFLRNTSPTLLRTRVGNMIHQIVNVEEEQYSNYRIGMRCGIAAGDSGVDLQDVMTHAMFALAKTKDDEKQDIWIFDAELHEQERADNFMENNAYKGIENEEFKLYLQPKVSLRDDKLAGAEALVRWVQSDGTVIYPGAFIPLFEENGFCAELDMYMFEKVCKLLRTWMDAGYNAVPISINLSKITFYKMNYVEMLSACLEKYDVPASMITLEILEGLAVGDAEALNRRLEQLKEIGFHISLDDFGTGYSSLNILGRLKIDEVKLDRGFLMEATENTKVWMILEEIVQLSKKLTISTVIEGIETERDAQLVKAIGCDIGQGYLYGKPISAEEFTKKSLQ